MKPPVTPFTTLYTQWLDSFRALLPGGAQLLQPREPAVKDAQAAANQEWEDEGGCITPEKKAGPASGPKIPF